MQQCIEPSAPLFPIVKSKVDTPESDATDRHPPDVTSGDTSGDTAVKEEPQPGTSAGATEADGTEADGTEADGTEAGKDEESEEEKYV